MTTLLTIENLSCRRNNRQLYSAINLSIVTGEIIQIVGVNGCGKTSLLRQICGLLPADEAIFCWQNQPCRPLDYSDELIYCGHRLGVDERLSVDENITWFEMLSTSTTSMDDRQVLEAVGLWSYRQSMVSRLSAGQKKRLSLARLLLYRRPLWVMDEPFNALDAEATLRWQQLMIEHSQASGAIIFTSHQPIDIEGIKTVSLSAGCSTCY